MSYLSTFPPIRLFPNLRSQRFQKVSLKWSLTVILFRLSILLLETSIYYKLGIKCNSGNSFKQLCYKYNFLSHCSRKFTPEIKLLRASILRRCSKLSSQSMLTSEFLDTSKFQRQSMMPIYLSSPPTFFFSKTFSIFRRSVNYSRFGIFYLFRSRFLTVSLLKLIFKIYFSSLIAGTYSYSSTVYDTLVIFLDPRGLPPVIFSLPGDFSTIVQIL